ncbi:1-deoxy-D-xylulose-5-phosphate synthase [Pantoea sp. Bo_2]|uniref:1-deoxy-D-xylulose-5-phosphate synthase n=1 Tax=Candidatus Pantoea gossypiicola TaxID=2608008 RepID=A0AB34CH34_9GAMM|nr:MULTISPECIES: 1-deoxy-D-xylulose-5-phosphate synthase [Pantoea]KAA5928637.1 1-deoxy-D-xylulose-5-phosphate synthase [Pantoea sp. VH_8]KAA5933769.1 1-deoxy-D-xylulose-5-phosphate synthase [Pantoea sp. VH_4]KAA5945034.1 1-deoxy-D-xylulose-5-phosphate synthase [Pantoea sp. VH_3]KAA5954894.1 1-deoxy-D-xylulose-5-phosphate synthase [Pantoea sp. VH_24]KAA5956958.1 1-deoxy-D-xylulose-5-phosphate synthase [Pantoea sp. VH_25]
MSFDIAKYPTLALADTVQALRALPKEKLPALCDELRQYLLDSVSRSSGHFASGLGVVELTVALHYVYNTPFDHLVWDVGHQAYPHKILTGRRDRIGTIRQKNGVHPFPWRGESEYDVLSVGHSSTSISAGLGMAAAAEREGQGRRTACIIGDGAITAGMAFEAMNHAGDIKPDMLVILNDNEMSISENVGALNNRLAQILSGKTYARLREGSKRVLTNLPPIKELVKRTEEHLKGMVVPGTLFEELGFNYIGPVDGHDVLTLVNTLSNMRSLKGPQFLHIMTKKGKGYAPAEEDPIAWHAVPKFDPAIGELPKSAEGLPSYSKIFGNWLCEMAADDPKLMAITPAMREGSGMVAFSREFPKQYFDVAIAEQHAVTFAAGMAIGGYKPIVAIYSTFLQRAYDQLIHDVAIQKLPVLFAIDRGGIVGADGQTHQGAFDLAYLRCVPDMVIMTPSDENECRQMLYTGYHHQAGPSAVRYPRGTGVGTPLAPLQSLPLGKAVVKRQGEKLAILNFGTLLPEAAATAEALNATLVDMRFVKPLDEALIAGLANTHDSLITLEEGAIKGGAGSGVNEFVMAKRLGVPVLNIGLPDEFIPQGTQDEVRHDYLLDAEGIQQQIARWLAQ